MSAPSAIQPSSPSDLLRAAMLAATAGHPRPGDLVCERLAAADPPLTALVRATIHVLEARLRIEHVPMRVLWGDPTDLDELLDRLLPGAAEVVWEKLELALGGFVITVLDRDGEAPPPDLPARPRLLEVMEHVGATLEVVYRRNDLVDGLLVLAARRLATPGPAGNLERYTCEEPGCLRDTTGFACQMPEHLEDDAGCFDYPASDRCKGICDWHSQTEEWRATHREPPNLPGVDAEGNPRSGGLDPVG